MAASAAAVGEDITVIKGARGECQFAVGYLDKDLLQLFRDDPYWSENHGFSWKNPKGSSDVSLQNCVCVEKPEEDSCNAKEQKRNVKLQHMGHTGKCLRDSTNGLCSKHPLPVTMALAFMEAFKCCNEHVWEFLFKEINRGPMSRFDQDDLGDNGRHLLKLKPRDWFGNIGTAQIHVIDFAHKENRHFDGGAACIFLVITLEACRTLLLYQTSGETKRIELMPGMDYLTGLCGIEHQVAYDGGDKTGRDLPGLGNVGVSLAFRTCLFPNAPWTKGRPGPEPVFTELNRVFRLMHSKLHFVLPRAGEVMDAHARATKLLTDGNES